MIHKEKLKTPACVAFLFAANWRIVKELFSIGYIGHMDSIEGTHISIARYILGHWPDLSWFPLWYGGIPFQNTYPPLLHMLVAAFAKLAGFTPEHAYHAVTAAMYCLGPVTLFWMAYQLSKERWYSFAAALLYSIGSTSSLLMKSVQADIGSPFHLRRLQALVQYGEGPHVASMALLPVAIVFLDLAFRKRTPVYYALAAIAVASVVLTNWLGGMALAIAVVCYLLAKEDAFFWRTWITAAAIGFFAYLLAAPWIPPSTVAVIRRNSLYLGGYAMTARHLAYAALFVLVAVAEHKLLAGRVRPFFRFLILFALFMSALPLAKEWGNINLVPQPERYHLEMEMAVSLGAVFIWKILFVRLRNPKWVWAAIALLPLCYFPWKHARDFAYGMDRPIDIHSTVEYKSAAWLEKNMPDARVLMPGSTGFFLNAFNEVPQINGGFEQGITNLEVSGMIYQVYTGEGAGAKAADIAIAWCKVFGIQAVGVGGPNSSEVYKPFKNPREFEGLLPVLWRDGDDVIYGIPQRSSSLAHVIRRLDAVPHRPWNAVEIDPLTPYLAALDDPALPPANLVWQNPHHMAVTADLHQDQLLSVQVSYHLGWRALVNGEARPLREDKLGLIEVEPLCEGRCTVDLIYDGGPEMRLVQFFSWTTLIGGLIWIWSARRSGRVFARAVNRIKAGLDRRPWVWTALAAGTILGLNLLLNWPFFRAGTTVYRDSIESGYASMARFIAAHPNPWGWNPTEYCGLPTQFTYLPGLLYLTAAFTWLLRFVEPAQVYRVVTVALACLAPVSFFFLALFFSKRRAWAFAGACAYTLLSPLHVLIRQIQADQGILQLPWRLQVLVKYGEGPHTAGLALLPLAIVALWRAGFGCKYRQVFVAAVLMAAIALTNWVAALSLAFCAGIFLLTIFVPARNSSTPASPFLILLRVLASAALAYLLAAFWLTPSLVRTVAFNWPADAFNYHVQRQQEWMLAGLAGGAVLLAVALAGLRVEAHLRFITLSLFAFGWIVLGHYWYGIDTIPESRRYALEFEMFLFLALFEWFRKAVGSRLWAVGSLDRFHRGALPSYRPAATAFYRIAFSAAFALALAAGVKPAWAYIAGASPKWRPIPENDTLEHRIAKRLDSEHPTGRVFVSGSMRYRLNSWYETPQAGGPFESGLRNRVPLHFAYQILTGIGSPPGSDGTDAVMQLKAMAVEYVVVHGPKSEEYFRDIRNPWKFEGLLPSVYREGDNAIYQLPVRSIAHLVRPSELPAWTPIMGYLKSLPAYSAAIGDAGRPALTAMWREANALEITGPIPGGMLVSVAVNYDPEWRAWQDGRPVPIETDKLGFLELGPAPSPAARIELKYNGGAQQHVMAGISALAWLCGIIALFVKISPRRRREEQ